MFYKIVLIDGVSSVIRYILTDSGIREVGALWLSNKGNIAVIGDNSNLEDYFVALTKYEVNGELIRI